MGDSKKDATGCCGGGHCASHTDEKKQAGACCGGGSCNNHAHDTQTADGSSSCCNDDACGCQHDQELALSAEQIARINTILGDIDDEDLETGDYDLTEEQTAELNAILFGSQSAG